MTELSPADFSEFFNEVYGYEPFPWQQNLAETVFSDGWPEGIQMPTGAGKTAAIDVAVFHLALEATNPDRSAPVRIFYTIDRRVVVDQAYRRANQLAEKLETALDEPSHQYPVTRKVAKRLTQLGDQPLAVDRLRGGLHSNDVWFENPAQPAIYPTTVDQIGSRLLFRGYGVSDSMKPVHAGLAGMDALYILDEVHLSQPFQQTLQRVSDLHEIEHLELPFQSVSMSATPVEQGWRSEETRTEDMNHSVLGPRLESTKQARPVTTEPGTHVDTLVSRAGDLVEMGESPPRRLIGITVNTVRTARSVYESLESEVADQWDGNANVSLIIGRAREWEKQNTITQLEEIASERSRAERKADELAPHFVVATQTIEVGADFDFDGLVTEVAPIDSLRQRLGRVDRFGALGTVQVDVVGSKEWISTESDTDVRCLECGNVMSSLGSHLRSHDLTKDEYIERYWQGAYDGSPEHPIYGRSMKHTWDWLIEQTDETGAVDLGATGATLPESNTDRRKAMCAPKKSAPTLLTPYMDLLSQTSPPPSDQIDPDVSLFLHGPDTSSEDVQVVWRSDILSEDLDITGDASGTALKESAEEEYAETLALRPPLPQESVDLPVWAIQRWLSEGPTNTSSTDIPDTEGGTRSHQEENIPSDDGNVLIWRGSEDTSVSSPADISPGDTIVIPATYGGHDEFSFNPSGDDPVVDISTLASAETDGSDLSFALTPPVVQQVLKQESSEAPSTPADIVTQIRTLNLDPRLPAQANDIETAIELLLEYVSDAHTETSRRYQRIFQQLIDGCDVITHPLYSDRPEGDAYPILINSSGKSNQRQRATGERQETPLESHLRATKERVAKYTATLPLDNDIATSQKVAAKYHDIGKLESRFQAWLQGGFPQASATPVAKSPLQPGTPQSREARKLAGYPRGRRHEAISADVVDTVSTSENTELENLTRYLIGVHHGYGRPLFPTPPGEQTPDTVEGSIFGDNIKVDSVYDHYELESEWSDLFWKFTEQYGPWSLAYLESFIRIADQEVSRDST